MELATRLGAIAWEKEEVLGMNIRKMKALLDERPRGKRWIDRFREAAQRKPVTRTGEGQKTGGSGNSRLDCSTKEA